MILRKKQFDSFKSWERERERERERGRERGREREREILKILMF
jgi:hypothetical protein